MKSFEKIIDSLGEVSRELVETTGSLQSDFKNQTNLEKHENISKAYLENIQQLDQINSKYKFAVNENQLMNKRLVEKLGELQDVEIKRKFTKTKSSSSSKQIASPNQDLIETRVDAQVETKHPLFP